MSINSRISELRLELGLTQEEFAERIHAKRVTVSWMEQEGHNITKRNISLISSAFGVNIDWLRSGTGTIFKDGTPLRQMLQDEWHMSGRELRLLQAFLSFKPEKRLTMLQAARELLERYRSRQEQ